MHGRSVYREQRRYRCDGSSERNCRLLGPPGALRHHKAYATAIVPVLKPAPRTRPCHSPFPPTLRPLLRPPLLAAVYRSTPQPPPHLIIGIYGKNLATGLPPPYRPPYRTFSIPSNRSETGNKGGRFCGRILGVRVIIFKGLVGINAAKRLGTR